MTLNKRETAIALAALRYFERHIMEGDKLRAKNGKIVSPENIEDLCQKIKLQASYNGEVVIEVRGGIAECSKKTRGIDVQIIDHDNG